MKVLLVGEFSGFHVNLKKGLLENGVEVEIAAREDQMRKIKVDIPLNSSVSFKSNNINKVIKGIYPFILRNRLSGYDVVQFIGPFLFCNKIPKIGLVINSLIYKMIIRSNEKVFFTSCGIDAFYKQIGKNYLRYNNCDLDEIDNPGYFKETNKLFEWNLDLLKRSSGVIPASYDYYVGYSKLNKYQNKISKIIPMPLATDYYPYQENIIRDCKYRFLHGITRPNFKGSKYILAALDRLKKKYPNDVEIVLVKNMPLNDYLKVIYSANVVLDQTNSYGYGMNALISMAQGRVVLSGSEKEVLDDLSIQEIPVINIISNENQIYDKLLYLLEKRRDITEMGLKSYEFVKKYHEAKIVANQYLKFWNSK